MNRKWVALLTAAVMLGTVPGMQVWAEPEEKVETDNKATDTTVPAETEEKKAEDAAAPAETKKDADTTVPAETEAEINGSVSSADELLQVAEAINDGDYTGSITLEKDIDLSNTKWPGIGNKGNQFKTTFDGQGHTVTLPGGKASLINYAIGATVKNVVVDSADPIWASESCGAGCVGGVVAHMRGGSIEGCGNLATIEGNIENDDWWHGAYAGGIAGYAQGTEIRQCWNAGKIDGNKAKYAAGIAGFVLAAGQDYSVESSISQCANMGAVSGSYCGGIAGRLAHGSTISDCSNSGSVTGDEMAAGIVAEVSEGKVQATLNTGTVDCDIAGQKQPVIGKYETLNTLSNSYYDSKNWTGSVNGMRRTTKDLADGEVTGLTAEQGWITKKSFYPYQSAGGDRAKAQAAAAYVTEKEGTAYLNLSTEGSWTHNGTSLSFGNTCTLRDGDILTYSYGGYEKSIRWSGDSKTARVMFGAPAEDSLTFTVKADGETVTPADGVYEIP